MTHRRTCAERGRKTHVRLNQIDLESVEGTARPGLLDREWTKELARTVQHVGQLDPILLWKNPETPSAPYIILDGRHRIAVYRTLKRTRKMPARVIECPFREALLISGKEHSNASLPLTPPQRADFAWRLVRVGHDYTKSEISQSTGVSRRQVGYMRARFREMADAGEEVTGNWWSDKNGQREEHDEPMMSQQERERLKQEAVKALRDLLDRRKSPFPFWDSEFLGDVILEALGERTIRELHEYSFGGLDDEKDGWSDLLACYGPETDPHAEPEEEPIGDF